MTWLDTVQIQLQLKLWCIIISDPHETLFILYIILILYFLFFSFYKTSNTYSVGKNLKMPMLCISLNWIFYCKKYTKSVWWTLNLNFCLKYYAKIMPKFVQYYTFSYKILKLEIKFFKNIFVRSKNLFGYP